MTRPLIYDDIFISILKDKMHDKFLGIFTIKVQSTTFFQKLNLQKGLMVSSLCDIIYGILSFNLFFNFYQFNKNNLSFLIENAMGVLCLFFGLIGLDASLNLKKINSLVYKNWRIGFTILYFFMEIANNFNYLCFFYNDKKECGSLFSKFVFFLFIFLFSMYLSKISWSFYIRLDQSHDLLIIHGKYLEKMLNEDNSKYEVAKKYTPPGNEIPSLLPKEQIVNTAGQPTEFNKTQEFKLFNNEKQILSAGDIRSSLSKDLKDN